MPTKLQNSEESYTSAMTLWPNKSKGRAKQGVEFTKAMQKIVKKNMMDDEPIVVPKKACLCAPTSHAGSFRCRLHRTVATQKSSSSIEDGNDSNACLKFDLKNMNVECGMVDGQPRLSRFGRAAAAGAPHGTELISPVLVKSENPSEVSISSKVVVNDNVPGRFC